MSVQVFVLTTLNKIQKSYRIGVWNINLYAYENIGLTKKRIII